MKPTGKTFEREHKFSLEKRLRDKASASIPRKAVLR